MEYKESTALSNAQLEDESSWNLLSCRKLIKMVKDRESLWNKRCFSLKQRKEVRPGTEVKKKFYELRKKFGQEVKKEKESAPRSGAGAGKPTYTSDWPLYKDLEFLRDVIKSRRKISNFPKKNVNQKPSPSPSLPATIIQRGPSPSCSSSNSDLESTLPSGSDKDNSSLMSPLPPSAVSVKRTVPAPDSSHVKKKKFKDDVAIAIDKYSDSLNILTDKLNKYLESLAPPTTQRNQPEDSLFISVLAAALARVPQEKKLSCIIEVLQVVQKYATEK